MRCKDVTSLLSDYLSGCLDRKTHAAVEAHLGGCPSCSADVDSTRKLLASLTSLGRPKAPDDLWESVRARITGEQWERGLWRRWPLRAIMAVPAVVVAALLVAVLLWPSDRSAVDSSLGREYRYYISSHWRLQRQQALIDPDVVLVRAELQKSALIKVSEVQ